MMQIIATRVNTDPSYAIGNSPNAGIRLMDDFLARQNIRRFEAQLKGECDPETRATLQTLLEAERKRLSQAIQRAGQHQSQD